MNNNSRILVILLFLVAIAFAAWTFLDVVIYMFIALVFTILGTPLVNLQTKIKFKKFQFPKTIAVITTMVVMFSLVYLFLRYFIPHLYSEIEYVLNFDTFAITENVNNRLLKYETLLKDHGFLLQAENLEILITKQITIFLESFSMKALFGNLFHWMAAIVIGLFSVLFMTFFSLKDNQIFFKLIQKLIPIAYRDNFSNIVEAIKKQLIRYFSGVFIEMLFVGVLVGVLCYFIGVPNAILIGFFAGLLNIIPYVGPLIAIVLSFFFAIAGLSPLPLETELIIALIVKVFISFVIVKLLDDFILQPIIYGRSVQAHPLEIFIVILLAGHIGGVLGMIFAVPAYSLLRIVVKELFAQYYLPKNEQFSN